MWWKLLARCKSFWRGIILPWKDWILYFMKTREYHLKMINNNFLLNFLHASSNDLDIRIIFHGKKPLPCKRVIVELKKCASWKINRMANYPHKVAKKFLWRGESMFPSCPDDKYTYFQYVQTASSIFRVSCFCNSLGGCCNFGWVTHHSNWLFPPTLLKHPLLPRRPRHAADICLYWFSNQRPPFYVQLWT